MITTGPLLRMLANIQTGFTVATGQKYIVIRKRFLPGVSTLVFVETLKFPA